MTVCNGRSPPAPTEVEETIGHATFHGRERRVCFGKGPGTRAAGCQIPLEDSYASQLHARLFRRNSELLVEDLGSTNGTFLNRKKVDSAVPIRKGDRLQVGKTVLELTK